MEKHRQTPSQTVGPFFAYGLTARQYGYDFTSIVDGSVRSDHKQGERIEIAGHVFDGKGDVIPDALVELWQADDTGRYRAVPIQKDSHDFKGFGRMGTGTEPGNRFSFATVKPCFVNGQAPHINVILFMRGSLRHLYTRLYFPDEDNEKDPLFQIADPARRQTLVARYVGKNEYHFDIHMQGSNETIFFDI
jgi:protocatechuate 3,4-dioxygenase alpha subunit